MNTYISILRGINVGGHKAIKMEALRQLCTELGMQQVSTYIQSGNVVFRAEKTDEAQVSEQIKTAIQAHFGYDVPILTVKHADLEQITVNNPFLSHAPKPTEYLHVVFLSEVPNAQKIDAIMAEKYDDDALFLFGKTVYLYCPNGYGNTKLSNAFFEKKLGVQATTRNWKTTETLLRLATDLAQNQPSPPPTQP